MRTSTLSRRHFLGALPVAAGGLAALASEAAASGVRITRLETLSLQDPGVCHYCIVRVHTDSGIEGIGQTESPATVIKPIMDILEDLIRGEDPTHVARLWQKMYSSLGPWSRRGVAVAAIGAVETALWDIAGKVRGEPVAALIWRSFAALKAPAEIKTRVRPYATVYLPGETEDEIRTRFGTAVARGFQAVKFEEVPGGFGHVNTATDARLIRLVREIIGPDRALMIDVQNIWSEVGQAVATCRAIAQYDIYFLEAPLPADNLEGYRRLADTVDIRIAVGDWGFTTRFEFLDLMDRGGVDVVQPSAVRSGGIAETLTIAEMAYRRGILCIPHCYHHMIGVAASVHVAAVVPNMPYIEFPLRYPHTSLVTDLLEPKLAPDADGWLAVPTGPGLGFTLNEDTVARYRVAL